MILVIGASGIVGQHLRLTQPDLPVLYTSQHGACHHDVLLKLTSFNEVFRVLDGLEPQVIVNLAGENRPDVVERDWAGTVFINMTAPWAMAQWCRSRARRLIHVSTQGVLGGGKAPYRAQPAGGYDAPVNYYGEQKRYAEYRVLELGGEVARLTFVLGIRPMPHVGRANPLESMLAAISSQTQVEDRYFSPAFALDAARELWKLVQEPWRPGRVVHIGLPIKMSRADIAEQVLCLVPGEPMIRVKHAEAFPPPKWAPRPLNTTFAQDARHTTDFATGLTECYRTWRALLDYMDPKDRATELGFFFGTNIDQALARLQRGFGEAHAEVTRDFHRAAPKDDADLLEWYRRTDAYIWELTAYHLDPGFNYTGMCDGIINHLLVRNRRKVLCVGDGVGDLTLRCADARLVPIYHDLRGSRTAEFAMFRMQRRFGRVLDTCLTSSWVPAEFQPESVDVVLALDFFEHVTDVEEWVMALWRALRPGGLFLAQNAFAIGDVEHGGDMPMHLSRNNRYEKDWDPLLDRLGFIREEGNWRRKP